MVRANPGDGRRVHCGVPAMCRHALARECGHHHRQLERGRRPPGRGDLGPRPSGGRERAENESNDCNDEREVHNPVAAPLHGPFLPSVASAVSTVHSGERSHKARRGSLSPALRPKRAGRPTKSGRPACTRMRARPVQPQTAGYQERNSSVLVLDTNSGVLLGVSIKRRLAASGTEVVRLPLIAGRPGGLLLVHIHAAHGILRHPPHLTGSLTHTVISTTSPRTIVNTPTPPFASALRGTYQWAIVFSVRRLAMTASSATSGATNIRLYSSR